MKEKKQDKSPLAFGRLMEYAGRFKVLTYLSLILSALSSMLALLPFIFIWRIIREVLEVQPDFSGATGIVRNGSGFLQIPPHGGHPCLRLYPSHYRAGSGLSPVRNVRRRAH